MAPLKYSGCAHFRQRIIAATLSGKPLIIKEIRNEELHPGLQDFEACYLRLLDQISDGCHIEINETGTILKYKPGIIVGGKITHDCGTSRGLGYYIEGLLPLAIFAKRPVQLTLSGVTNNNIDISVDILRTVTIPLLKHFGIENIHFAIKKRGAAPNGGGTIEMTIPIVREIAPVLLMDCGFIKRIRGVAFCARISPTVISRVVEAARGVLNNYIPDVYINTEHYRGADGGASAGYSLSLVAESTTGALLSVERTAEQGELPETIGTEGAQSLLLEIANGGYVDSEHQCLALQLMVVGPEDVTKVRFGKLTEDAIDTLRLLRDAFGVVFKIREEPDSQTMVLSCLGVGYQNVARRAT